MRVEEHRIQRQIVEYLILNRVEVFAIPNGGNRDPATAMILKREGVRRGVADLMVIGKSNVYFIEIKTQKGKQSEFQKNFEKIVNQSSVCKYMVWRCLDDAEEFIDKYRSDIRL